MTPQQLTGLRNYRFWYIDDNKQPRTFTKPMPEQEEMQYFRQVEDLARERSAQAQGHGRRPAALAAGGAVADR